MKYLLPLVFLSVITSGSGEDETCEKENLKDRHVMTCADDTLDKCMRAWYKKDGKVSIANSCTNQDGCTATEKFCDEFDWKCAVACCDTDKYNVSSTLSFSVILKTACSVFGLALLK